MYTCGHKEWELRKECRVKRRNKDAECNRESYFVNNVDSVCDFCAEDSQNEQESAAEWFSNEVEKLNKRNGSG